MSIKGFSVNGVVQRYDYTALDNLPQGQGVSDDLKAALLQLAQKVAYIDDQGQTYYDDLYNALYPEKTLLSITANFQQGQAVVYNTDSLDSLKQYLTVTAIYDDASTELVPSSAYTLSGTLTTGTSVITVTYEGKTDAFNVVVTAAPIALTVTNNLTGCTTSNSATSVLENTSYTAVITASSGYTLVGATVSITMGGQDITTSAYSGGIISINNVTGALVISVAAAAVVLSSISAVYTQGGTVWSNDTLDSLKDDLVVTAHYSDSSTQTVPAADYALSGTLTVGTATIIVSYGGKTATFNVTVTHQTIPSGYITDGLVFFLDAKQLASASSWEDIISGKTFTLTDCTKNTNQDGIVFNGTSSKGTYQGQVTTDWKTETIEVCIENGDFSGSSGTALFAQPYGTSVGISLRSGYDGGYNSRAGLALDDVNHEFQRFINKSLKTLSCCDGLAVANGAVQTLSTATTYYGKNEMGVTILGACNTVNNEGYRLFFNGTIHAVRIYNRKLSASEMQANQQADATYYGITL